MSEYEKSLNWYKSNPKAAAELVVKNLPMLDSDGLADSIEHINLNHVNAIDSKKDLEFFYNVLKNSNPKSIGGKLPTQGFYYE